MPQCKLCQQQVVKLEDSHFLSKGIYKRLRDDAESNPNPWMLTPKKAVQTSEQMKAPLLCRDCEQRFCKFGEDWVLKNCPQKDGSFPLLSLLTSKTADISSPETKTRVYYASNIAEMDRSALAYFAASIFWRGSIHPWNSDRTIPVMLGPFQEQFRQYLLGLQTFPKDCALWVAVREGRKLDRLTFAPVGERKGILHLYRFPMPGFAFSLAVSKNIPTGYRDKCFVHGPGNPIIVTDVIEPMLFDEAMKMRRRQAAA